MKTPTLPVLVLCLIQSFSQTAYGKIDGSLVKHGRIFSIADFLNVHSSPKYWLQAGGKRFNDVAGVDPFYIPLDSIDAIFFVTDPWKEKMTAHIFLLRERRDIEFPVYYEGFDSHELGRPESARGSVIVDKINPPIVLIRCKRDLASDLYEFNIETGKCSKIKK
jgi:hypothetical protein